MTIDAFFFTKELRNLNNFRHIISDTFQDKSPARGLQPFHSNGLGAAKLLFPSFIEFCDYLLSFLVEKEVDVKKLSTGPY